MPKYLHLDIPKPCHEDWNKMSAETQGRFCGSCQKTVTDFTNMSDAQLVAFFKNPKPSVCGRFTQEQLERDILIPRKRVQWVKYFFQFTLPAFLWSLKSSGQTMGEINVTPPIQKMAVEKPSKLLGDTAIIEMERGLLVSQQLVGRLSCGLAYSANATRNITGKVTDPDGNPLPGASVFIKGTNNAVAADTGGNFLFPNVRKKATVMASYVGFESKEVVADGRVLNIQLTPQMMGEVVMIGALLPTKKSKKTEAKKVCIKAEVVSPSLTIYPNPVQRLSLLHLQWHNLEEGNYRVEIYSAAGVLMKAERFVVEKELKETSVTINEIPAGNYFARIINTKTSKPITAQFIVRE